MGAGGANFARPLGIWGARVLEAKKPRAIDAYWPYAFALPSARDIETKSGYESQQPA